MITTRHRLPMILDEVEVVRVNRLSPSFVRVELGGACLAEFGVDGPLYDQRIKLIFPGVPGGRVPVVRRRRVPVRRLAGAPRRGARPPAHLHGARPARRGGGHPPGRRRRRARRRARRDRPGLRLGPARRGRRPARPDRPPARRGVRRHRVRPGYGGPAAARGDETALPAIAAILAELPWHARGAAFIEVPQSADVQTLQHPEGVEVVWLVREGAPLGARLHAAVLEHLGTGSGPVDDALDEEGVDRDLWGTPTYSSSGEDVGSAEILVGHDLDDLYAWIAGESGVVTGLRRVLANDLGVDRRQVAFMGYWRRGTAMRG